MLKTKPKQKKQPQKNPKQPKKTPHTIAEAKSILMLTEIEAFPVDQAKVNMLVWQLESYKFALMVNQS